MADRVVVIDIYEVPGHKRIGSRVGSTLEYTPDTQEQNVYKVFAAFVNDGNIAGLCGDIADTVLGGSMFP